jgi:hypothetical protein
MKTPEIILKELMRSMTMGSLLGLLIKLPTSSTFIITKVQAIAEDPMDPDNRIVSLFSKDIHGNTIPENRIMSRNIVDVRPYYRLSGVIE